MKGNELRIGNKVIFKDRIVEVVGVSETVYSFKTVDIAILINKKLEIHPLESMKPIALTRKMIEKIGFKEAGDAHLYKQNGIYVWCRTEGNDAWISEIDDVDVDGRDIWYLHQLQNLFFALIGKELEVKL